METLDPIRDEIQNAVRNAHVMYNRGDSINAEKLIHQIALKYPDHPDALEALADIYAHREENETAIQMYKEIITKFPGRVSTEKKHANLVFNTKTKAAIDATILSESEFKAMMNPGGMKRTSGVAALCSFLLPGFGQIYNGELMKGIVCGLIAAVLWLALIFLGYHNQRLTSLGWVFLLALVSFYVGVIFDAASAAPTAQANIPQRKQPPKPPVDKPF